MKRLVVALALVACTKAKDAQPQGTSAAVPEPVAAVDPAQIGRAHV